MTEKELTELAELIILTIDNLQEAAKHKTPSEADMNINEAIGEMDINGKEYQLQISLMCDKRVWLSPDGVTFSEVTRKFD